MKQVGFTIYNQKREDKSGLLFITGTKNAVREARFVPASRVEEFGGDEAITIIETVWPAGYNRDMGTVALIEQQIPCTDCKTNGLFNAHGMYRDTASLEYAVKSCKCEGRGCAWVMR